MVDSGVPQGSVLGPILFLIYADNAARGLDCEVAMFADDMKIWSVIRGPADEERLQMNLNRLEEWSNRWLLRFNVAKCSILRLGNTARSVSTRGYFLGGAALQEVDAQRNLGVLTTSSLKPSAHCSRVPKSAMSVLYAIKLTRVERMPRKSKNTPSSKAPLRKRTKDLCEQLLRLCSSTDPADGLAYFKNLQVITTELSTLQKDKCLVRNLPKSASERRNFLLRLQSRLGACFLKSVEFRQTGDSGFGILSTEDIQEQECVLRISMKHILSARSVIAQFPPVLRGDPLLCGMENVALSLSLLHELSLGEQSTWYDYLYSLPVSYSTVMYFSAEQMELLSGFPTAGMALNAFRSICRQYAYFFLLFEKTDTLLGNMKFFCFADYCWAVSVVMSRNNRLPDPDCPDKEVLCLIPLWDMINHRSGRVTTDVNVETKTIEFYAMEACPPSSEVFMDYGRRTSAEFLLYCGFVPPSNPHHRTPLVLSLSKFDKLLQARTDLLRRLGYPPEISPLVACNDVTIPSSEAACFARVFVMNEDELRQYTEDVEKDFISGSKRLLSTEFDQTRVDTSALTFLETRVDLLIKKYTSNLAKTTEQIYRSWRGTFRQVPDNQEVFVNDDNNESLSIDILDSVDATSPEEAARRKNIDYTRRKPRTRDQTALRGYRRVQCCVKFYYSGGEGTQFGQLPDCGTCSWLTEGGQIQPG
nr:unnamed protein product [Spirometra erinaceieuropaei]